MSKMGIFKKYGGAGSRHGGARRITHVQVVVMDYGLLLPAPPYPLPPYPLLYLHSPCKITIQPFLKYFKTHNTLHSIYTLHSSASSSTNPAPLSNLAHLRRRLLVDLCTCCASCTSGDIPSNRDSRKYTHHGFFLPNSKRINTHEEKLFLLMFV